MAVHVFNTVSLRWTALPLATTRAEHAFDVPCPRQGLTAVLIEGVVYIWGGMCSHKKDSREYCSDLYAFDVDAHRLFTPQVSGTVPERREDHSACVLGLVMYIHGGLGRINDIYKLDTTTMVWSLINTRGKPAAASRVNSAIIGTKMFEFGEWDLRYGSSYSTIRVFDTETNCWLDTPSAKTLPEGPYNPSAFAYNGELLCISGGNNSSTDVWKFNPDSLSWKKLQLTGKGLGSKNKGVRCCAVRDRIILFSSDDRRSHLHLLEPTNLKALCKLAVMQYSLEQSGLPHNIRWELAVM